MGYSNLLQVDQMLAQALSSARPDISGDKINLLHIPGSNPNPIGVNKIPDSVVYGFISSADKEVDGILSQMYKTPLKKCAYGEWMLDADLDEYNQTVELNDACNLIVGDEFLIRDDDSGTEERHIVATVEDYNSITTQDPILTNFSGDNVRVLRIDYPAPVGQISARYAASFIFDKYFAAQNDPNTSEYGDKMRLISMQQLNDILNGRTQLDCQLRKGDRFGNPWIDSRYALREHPQSFNSNDRNMSKL